MVWSRAELVNVTSAVAALAAANDAGADNAMPFHEFNAILFEIFVSTTLFVAIFAVVAVPLFVGMRKLFEMLNGEDRLREDRAERGSVVVLRGRIDRCAVDVEAHQAWINSFSKRLNTNAVALAALTDAFGVASTLDGDI